MTGSRVDIYNYFLSRGISDVFMQAYDVQIAIFNAPNNRKNAAQN